MSTNDDDLFLFESEDAEQDNATESWNVLVVDDDVDVHDATRYALKNHLILGKPVDITSAYSATEAKEKLAQDVRFACILLDVVMETPDAGLQLVNYIRNTLHEDMTRIILRTGQPGYAPELTVIDEYDINDYKSKDELTRNRLITSLTSSLRSYQQIQTIRSNKEGLAMIINGAPTLFKEREVGSFAQGVVLQLCSLLQLEENGFLCCQSTEHKEVDVLAAYGRFQALSGCTLTPEQHPEILSDIQRAFEKKAHLFLDDHVMLYMQSPHHDEIVVRVDTQKKLSEIDLHLLELFSVSISVGFDNARLFEQMEKVAYVDSLTELPNRSGILHLIEARIRDKKAFSMILADIDDFQAINDGLGYKIGNLTLQKVAQHLTQQFPDALIGRSSSDIFCILLDGHTQDEMKALLAKLEESLTDSFNVADYEIPISITMGISHYPEHANDPVSVLQNAGIALKHAKKSHRAGYMEFGTEFEQQLQKRLRVAAELRNCVERQELQLVFQPQISLDTQKIIGAEALVRWQHKGETIPPNEFISTAESSGYIVPMGFWILEEACRQQVLFAEETGHSIIMAVNVSVRQLKDPKFLDEVNNILTRTGISPDNLEMEVTESMMMEDSDSVLEVINQIRKQGIRLALDDFGTGYSSISYLKDLPIDYLKIDRSFIKKINESKEDCALTSLMVNIGEQLNLKVIAEGVEYPEQQEELIRLGCHQAQGYLYSKPVSKDKFKALLTEINGPVS